MIGVSQLDVTPGGKMRNLLILGVLILVVAAPVRSQEYPKAEAFGGSTPEGVAVKVLAAQPRGT
jgi:hypothetical protein